MSLDAWRAAWANPPASRTHLLVLLCYADAANEDGEAWPSCATVARRCLLEDEKHVRRVLRALARSGHLQRIGPHSDPRYRYATVYRLTFLPHAGQRGVDGKPSPAPHAAQRGVDPPATPLPHAGQPPYPTLGSVAIPLEIQREREAKSGSQECRTAERRDDEAMPTDGQSDEDPLRGKAGSIETGQQKIRDELRRQVVSCGNSDHFADWLNLARQAGARTSSDAVWILRWMIDRARACGEAIKFPSHVTAQVFPARAALDAHRRQNNPQETRQAL